MLSSKFSSLFWYLPGALLGIVIGMLAARASGENYIQTHPGEEYDRNLQSIISVVIVPLAGAAGAIVGVMLVGLIRAPRAALGWIILSVGSVMILATLPIRAMHGWPIALCDLALGAILIGIGLKVTR